MLMNRVVRIDDTAMPDGVIAIADQLPSRTELEPGDSVTLRFGDAFVYLTGWSFSRRGESHCLRLSLSQSTTPKRRLKRKDS